MVGGVWLQCVANLKNEELVLKIKKEL